MTSTPASPEQMIGRRNQFRLACELGVDVRLSGSEWRRALLRDISAAGFMVIAPLDALPRGSLWLRLPDIAPVPARVRWRQDGMIGCQFLYTLERSTLDHIATLVAGKARQA
jgi:hypothetical protein